jgi:hypothetical protein
LENKIQNIFSQNNFKQEDNILPLTLNSQINDPKDKRQMVNTFHVKSDIIDLTHLNNISNISNISNITDRLKRFPLLDTEKINNDEVTKIILKTPLKVTSPRLKNIFYSSSAERKINLSSEKKKIFKVTETSNEYVNYKRHRDESNENSKNLNSTERGRIKKPFFVFTDPSVSRSVENKKSDEDFLTPEKNLRKRKPKTRDSCPCYSSDKKRKSHSNKKKEKYSKTIQVDKSILITYPEVKSDSNSGEKSFEDDPNFVTPRNLTRSALKKTIKKDGSVRNLYNMLASEDKSLKLSSKKKKTHNSSKK